MRLIIAALALNLINIPASLADDVTTLHQQSIVIDAHSDFLDRSTIDGSHLAEDPPHAQTTLSKLKQGQVDAQFFSVFVPPAFEEYGYAKRTLELIDRFYEEVEANPNDIRVARSADDIIALANQGYIAALMGIEGGHSIEDSLALLRVYYRLGVRYLTLTWTNTNNWADSSGDDPRWGGLNQLGIEVIREMNDLGMMIDVSHVAEETFYDVIKTTRAPVIASHSLTRAVKDSSHNMSDEMIRALAETGGVLQVSFYGPELDPAFSVEFEATMSENRERLAAIEVAHARDPIAQDIALWTAELALERSLPPPPMTRVVDHIDHIVKLVGVDHVGLGSDFDGLGQPPAGLEHVGKFEAITRELVERGYTGEDVARILGGNLLRVMREVEKARTTRQGPADNHLSRSDHLSRLSSTGSLSGRLILKARSSTAYSS